MVYEKLNCWNCLSELLVKCFPHCFNYYTYGGDTKLRRTELRKELDKHKHGLKIAHTLDSSYTLPSYQWNISHGCICEILQTPPNDQWTKNEVDRNHSKRFPELIKEEIERAKHWVDILSLTPPDCQDPNLDASVFDEAICDAIGVLGGKNDKQITVRFLFAEPLLQKAIDVESLCNKFTRKLQGKSDVKLKVWVGAYRKWTSWNHSKIIAVDGRRVTFGGHNMWDGDYLYESPVHDMSLVTEGEVAEDAHVFADKLWFFLGREIRRTCKINCCCFCYETHGQISQWPKQKDTLEQPGLWSTSGWSTKQSQSPSSPSRSQTPLHDESESDNKQQPPSSSSRSGSESDKILFITVGRLGQVGRFDIGRWGRANPSDRAITALLDSAEKWIRLSQQDIGPPTKDVGCGFVFTLPGLSWVDYYLNALARAIRRGVKVEIVVSNAESGCFDKYGSGWTPDNIAAQIMKRVIGGLSIDENFEARIKERLCITYIRRGREGRTSEDARKSLKKSGEENPKELPIANHVKLIAVDGECYYLGSQNLYMCDLAEWGAIVVDREATLQLYEEYWDPMWKQSWDKEKPWGDCDYDQVIKECKVNSSSPDVVYLQEKRF